MTRRDAGWLVLQAAATLRGREFFGSWLVTADASHKHGSAPPEPDRWNHYQPRFFSAEDYAALEAFTAILIPTDDTPGAREAHVAAFIDFVVSSAAEYAPEIQERWRGAMAWLREQGFAQMSTQQRISLVEAISGPERDPAKRHDGFATYKLIKQMTVHAFYTSRAGLVENLEYQGLTYLDEFPGCKHPEHHRV
jgi:hypothetical protein